MKKLLVSLYLVLAIIFLSGCSKTETIKDTINREVEIIVDYSSSNSLKKAIEEKTELKNKIAKILVSDVERKDSGIKFKSLNNLNFMIDEEYDIVKNDYVILKIIKEPVKKESVWEIECEIVDLIKTEESDFIDENKDVDNQKTEEKIKLNKDSSDYIGLDKIEVEKELKEKGFSNIELKETITNNDENKNNSISSIKINGKDFKKEEVFKKEDSVVITYWKLEEAKTSKIVLPKEDSKLGKDFDSDEKNTIYYINVDGTKNVPKIQKWNGTTVTDGVAEYLDYLKELGFKVSITKKDEREPYKGFKLYETYFLVESDEISWTMFLSIQDEKYTEYELDINKN